MFDALIRELSQRFGLGDKGQALIAQLLGAIFDPNSGGISGLLARFKQQGLGDLFSSWLGNASGQAAAPTPQQTESVLGAGTIGAIADKLGLARGTVVAAASAALPRVIGALTPNGQLPTGIPASISGMLSGLGGLGGAAAAGASAVANRAAGAAQQAAAAADDAAGGLGWLKWLVLAAIVLALGYCMLNRKPAPPAASAPPAAETKPAPAPAPTADPKLSLGFDNGKLTYSGQVGSEADKGKIIDALKAAYGDGNISGDLGIDANTKPIGWLGGLTGLLPDLKVNGAKLDLVGSSITLGGTLPDADKLRLSDRLRALFGGFSFSGLAEATKADAAGALSALAPGKFSADDLVKALNLMIIHFETGSATISADSMDILGKAAAALKAAPAGTKVEVGGHTDNTGNAEANMKLSDARANAVRAKLVELGVAADSLTAKGFGDTQPVADNATDEGRARNRRIGFVVLH